MWRKREKYCCLFLEASTTQTYLCRYVTYLKKLLQVLRSNSTIPSMVCTYHANFSCLIILGCSFVGMLNLI